MDLYANSRPAGSLRWNTGSPNSRTRIYAERILYALGVNPYNAGVFGIYGGATAEEIVNGDHINNPGFLINLFLLTLALVFIKMIQITGLIRGSMKT